MAESTYVNKVIYGGQTLIDLTGDTATEADVAQGKTFHLASGAAAVGTFLSGGSGYAPIGSVLMHAGNTPPGGCLACDGTVYSIADYPDLARFIEDSYGSANYWGGDGTGTFAVPDWQGEFFRAAAPNSRGNREGVAPAHDKTDAGTARAANAGLLVCLKAR